MGNLLDCAQHPLNSLPDDGEAMDDASSGRPVVLQKPTRLKDSMIWELQRMFYDKNSVGAWSEGIVPNFVTSNSFIGRAYAKVLLGMMKDVLDAPGGGRLGADRSQPVYIVELGAGHGKFSYLVVEALLQMQAFLPTLSTPASKEASDHAKEAAGDDKVGATLPPSAPSGGDATAAAVGVAAGAGARAGAGAGAGKPVVASRLPFKYILTDFTAKNVEHWKKHPSFDALVAAGAVDFAVFDAEKDTELKLEVSGDVVSAETVANPMVFICNYVFDTLTTDAFRMTDGVLQKAHLELLSTKEETDPTAPDVIRRMTAKWSYELAAVDEDFYGDEEMNAIVRTYAERHKDASFLVPIGGLRMLRSLIALSRGRLLVLAGDKGYNFEEELVGHRDPHIAIHGSFSFMVNFHAIKMYMDAKDGFAVQTPHQDGFKCSAYFLGGEPADFTQARWAFKDSIQDFGPENFSTLQRCIKEECANPSLKHVLALLRLGHHDSDVFFKFKQVLIDKVQYPYATELVQTDVRRDVDRIHAGYYPLQSSKDVCFEVGRLLMGLKEYAKAVQFFKRSNEACGEHHVTWHNSGICQYYLENYAEATKCFTQSLNIRSDYREARVWLAKVNEKSAHSATAAAATTYSEDDTTDSDEDGDGE